MTKPASRKIRQEERSIEDLASADVNPKRHDEPSISRSISALGFIEVPVLDERTGRLIGGHGRRDSLLATKAAGQPPPEGVRLDPDGRWMVPVTIWRSRNDAEARAALVALNRLPELGGWDERELVQALTNMDSDLRFLAGYDDSSWTDLRAASGVTGDEEAAFLSDLQSGTGLGMGGTTPLGLDNAISLTLVFETRSERDYVASFLRQRLIAEELKTAGGALVALCALYDKERSSS